MRFKLDKYNFNSLLSIAEIARKNKVDKLEIELAQDAEDLPYLSEIISCIYPILDYEIYYQVWLKNFPFCLIEADASDHLLENINFKGEKTENCQRCVWFGRCPGFPKGYFKQFGRNEICVKRDIPEEVMIEVEPKCNFKCKFCFNQISFAKETRNIKSFSTDYVKKIIDAVFKSGVRIIRFTGGEPMLRKDIFQLLKYAKNKDLEVRLNTNASLIDEKTAKKMKGIVDNILIPIWNYKDKKKAKAIEYLKKQDIPVVRAGTVATKENIFNFDKIAHLISLLPLDAWELYRPIPVSNKRDLTSKGIKILTDKLIDLRKTTEKNVFIANAIPFCSIKDLNKLNAVSKGALSDDGHSRMVIDPRGFSKPHYFLDEDIGKPLEIEKAWQSQFMRRMRGLEFLPQECHDCPFAFKCRGGSRQAAKMTSGNYDNLDPLSFHVKKRP